MDSGAVAVVSIIVMVVGSHIIVGTGYASGAPVTFGDRAEVEGILDRNAGGQYGVRSLTHAVIQSDMFRSK